MKKMGMRVISAVLAVCMMATALSVSAVASEGGGTDNESGVSAQAAEAVLPFAGKEIVAGGTYEMTAGIYTGAITINTTGNVTIDITGEVTYTGTTAFITVNNVGTLTINGAANGTDCKVASETNQIFLNMPNTLGTTAVVNVKGGDYEWNATVGTTGDPFEVSGGILNLKDATVVTLANAVWNGSGSVHITGGQYTGKHGSHATLYNGSTMTVENAAVISEDNICFSNANSGVMTLINVKADARNGNAVKNAGRADLSGKTFISKGYATIWTLENATTNVYSGTYERTDDIGQVFSNSGTLTIDEDAGKTITINSPNGTSVTVANLGTLHFKSGTVTSPNGTAIGTWNANAGGTAQTIITGGVVKNSKNGIRVSKNSPTVELKDVTFEGNENDIQLIENQKITIDDSFAKRATIKVAEDAITIPRRLTVSNQAKLNLVSRDDGYYVAYDKENKYYVLNQRTIGKYIVDAELATATTADGTVLDANTEIEPSTIVTLTAKAPDEGWVFDSWQVTKGSVTLEDTDTVVFEMPEGDVAVSAQYRYVGNDDSDGGAGAVVAGALIGSAAYLVGTRVWLESTFGYVPANRMELALGLWKHAGCPEPESTALYPDVDADDTDGQKAARWCVERDLMKDYHKQNEDGTETVAFKPGRYVARPYALSRWYRLEKLLKDQQAAETVPAETEAAAEAQAPAQTETTSEN